MVAIAKPTFSKATKRNSKLRLGLVGPSGAGKTWTALMFAREMVAGTGLRVAVLDSERGSASKYADDFDFDVIEPTSFHPEQYIAVIKAAEEAGYGALVIDSLSHAWMGKDGALEQVDKAAARAKGNSFAAWREVTPMHNDLVEAMIGSKLHLIATMRAKTEWVVEEQNGKKTPKKIGLAPVQRDGLEYEFDIVGDIDHDHVWCVTKSRCSALADAVVRKPGPDVAGVIKAWVTGGAAPLVVVPTRPPPASVAEDTERRGEVTSRLKACAEILGLERCRAMVGSTHGKSTAELEAIATTLEDEIARVNAAPAAEPEAPVWSEEERRGAAVARLTEASRRLGADESARILGHRTGTLTGKPADVIEAAAVKLEAEVAKLPPPAPPAPAAAPPRVSAMEAQLGASVLVEMAAAKASPARKAAIAKGIEAALLTGEHHFPLPYVDPRADGERRDDIAEANAARELDLWRGLKVGRGALWKVLGEHHSVIGDEGARAHVVDGVRLALTEDAVAALKK